MKKYEINLNGKTEEYEKLTEDLILRLKTNVQKVTKISKRDRIKKSYSFDYETPILPNEKWEKYPEKFLKEVQPLERYSKYSEIEGAKVSNKGRVQIKLKGRDWEFAEQYEYSGKEDLRIKNYPLFEEVYRMVLRTFVLEGNENEPKNLKDNQDKRQPVHHIDNNGFNNCLENLMYIEMSDHNSIH